jgi:3',5'-cyclic AMP phosphodiesterase CpdA
MRFIVAAFLLLAGSLPAQPAYTDLIHISDSHVAILDGVQADVAKARGLHRQSLSKLEAFVEQANAMPAMTLVHTGDVVDATCFDGANGQLVEGQIEAVRRAFGRLRHPYHLALGNHDVECYRYNAAKPDKPVGDQSVAARSRRQWRRAFPFMRRRTYYSAAVAPGYRLVVLDNGHSLEAKGGRDFYEKQMRWLERELRRYRQGQAILALHIPVAADAKSERLKQVLRGAPGVGLILCGHRHTDAVEWLELGERRVLQVRTGALYESPQAWRRIRLYGDRVEVSGVGSVGSSGSVAVVEVLRR